MIPRAHITAWRGTAPWASDAQVEQDLVISRALVDLYHDDLLSHEFVYRFDSEVRPVTPLKLKVEINTREHFTVLGLRRIRFQVDNPWYRDGADLLTFAPEELLGTKVRALYQRKKGRDLFDLSETLSRLPDLDTQAIIDCFLRYLEHDGLRVSRAEFERNLVEKMDDDLFLRDVPPLLAAGISYDPQRAFELIQRTLISKLP